VLATNTAGDENQEKKNGSKPALLFGFFIDLFFYFSDFLLIYFFTFRTFY